MALKSKWYRPMALLMSLYCIFGNFNTVNAETQASRFTAENIIMLIGNETAYVDGTPKSIDQNTDIKVELKDERTFVPLRFVSENMGAHVEYNSDTCEAEISLENDKVIFGTNSNMMIKNGQEYLLDAGSFLYEDRIFIPVRALTEAFGNDVYWNPNGLVIIGKNLKVSDEDAYEIYKSLYASEVTEAAADTYFEKGVLTKRAFAAGTLNPNESTLEFTVTMKDRDMLDMQNRGYDQFFQIRYNTPQKADPGIMVQSYFYPLPKKGLRFTFANGNEWYPCNAENFTFEKNEKFNIALSWKENDKVKVYKNGKLIAEAPMGKSFTEEMLPYSFWIKQGAPFYISQARLSSVALNENEIMSDPEKSFISDENTSALIYDNLEKIDYFISKWHKESGYSEMKPAWRNDKQIYVQGENPVYPVFAMNNSGENKKYTVNIQMRNENEERLFEKKVEITVPNDKKRHIYEIHLNEISNLPGLYSITTEIADTDSEKHIYKSDTSIFPHDNTVSDGKMADWYGNEFVRFDDFSIYTKGNQKTTRLQALFEWKNIEPEKGKYQWDFADAYVDECRKNGVQILGVLGKVPQWAANEPSEEVKQSSGYVDGIYCNSMPRNIEDWKNYVYNVVSRYKDVCKYWEPWNEISYHPPYSAASFYGTTEEAIQIQKATYEAAKAADPTCYVTTSGWGGGDPSLYLKMTEPEISQYYDVYNVHGYEKSSSWQIGKKALEETRPNMQYWMGEEMPYNISDPEQQLYSMVDKVVSYYAAGYTKYLRMGAGIYEHFYSAVSSSPTKLYQADAAFQNFIRKCDNYEEMYTFKNDTHCSLRHYFKRSDGKYLNILGSCTSQGMFEINGNITEIYDIFGSKVDFAPGEATQKVNLDKILYIISEEPIEILKFNPFNVYKLSDSNVKNVVKNSNVKPFDRETFKMNENINWTEDGFEWISENETRRPQNYKVKFCTNVSEEGMYLAVDVSDDKIVTPTDGAVNTPANMWQFDSVQFAFDTLGTGNPNLRAEFQVGIYNGKACLFKHFAPDLISDTPAGWSYGLTTLDNKYVDIEYTGRGLLYKIFVPISEMYPFDYLSSADHLRFSLLVNNNDGSERNYTEWSTGIGSDKDPRSYGAIEF